MPNHYSDDFDYDLHWAKKGHDPRRNGPFKNKKDQKEYIKMLEGFIKKRGRRDYSG